MKPLTLCTLLLAVIAASAAGQEPPRTDSRARYAHRLTLYDATGRAIDPADQSPQPYSPQATCGKCHDSAAISGGWHFNAAAGQAPDGHGNSGRAGEPWLWVDPRSGTQLPLSYRGWAGCYDPRRLGLSEQQMLVRFGTHLPGGIATTWLASRLVPEPGQASLPATEPVAARKLEIDCMVCHSATGNYDFDERAAQVARHNFDYVPTAAAGLAAIRGSVRDGSSATPSADDMEAILRQADPAGGGDPASTNIMVVYDKSKFDADKRVFLDITRRPAADRCLLCHTTRQVGPDAPPRWSTDSDVHLSAGMACTDCHRNGIDHDIVRGFEGESGDAHVRTLTCQACHLGDGGSGLPGNLPGRLKAPRAEHRGLPDLHLKKMSCTACHAGPWPGSRPTRWQTSLAHNLGVSSKDRRDNASPAIVAPIFVRDADGRITPQRAVWPSFWARRTVNGVRPIPLDEVDRLAGAFFSKRAEPGKLLTVDEITRVLTLLADPLGSDEAVYVSGGRVVALDRQSGGLKDFDDAAASPCYWPIGHDVRPAGQSLGSGGCTDCHSPDSAFVFGVVSADPSPVFGRAPVLPMHRLQDVDAGVMSAWAFGFSMRPVFIAVGFACAGVLVVLIVWQVMLGLARLTRRS